LTIFGFENLEAVFPTENSSFTGYVTKKDSRLLSGCDVGMWRLIAAKRNFEET
jgi:hypothetical protein